MSEDFRVQFSVKTPRDSMLNIRADSIQEFETFASWALSNAARFIDLETAIKGVPQALAANVTQTQVQRSGWSGQQQQQQQQPSNEPNGPAPTCMHGPRNFKTGNRKDGKGSWQAWDCPENVCDRQWAGR